MKQTKKLFSIVLAIALVFAMAIPAFAAEQTGNIVINSATNVSVDGKVFKAYKILDAKAVDTTDLSDGIVYSIPTEMQTYYDGLCGGDDNKATVAEVEAYINALSADALLAFAKDALAAAKTASIAPVTTTGADDKATFTSIPFGYYVIEDTGAATPISAVMLNTTNDVELNLKADKPSITKKIDGAIDGDGTTTSLVDYNTATVGETVPYVLTSAVPVMTGYTSYTYVVTDTLSPGLTFVDGDDDDTIVDVAITVGGVKYTDYTVTEVDNVMTITFNNMLALTAGDEIKITYAATVNENAIIGVEGNPNVVNLTYSNNPQVNTTEKTPDDVVRTYLVDLIINKTDDKDQPLAGAGFTVYQGETAIAEGISDENGTVTFTWTNGVGLKDGVEYKIVETTVPAGFNKAEDITFTVTCEDPAENATPQNCVWSSNNGKVTFTATTGDGTDDYFETTIKNLTGALLPETGGMGTTMFYMIGAMMVAAAVVLMITKKRMAFEA